MKKVVEVRFIGTPNAMSIENINIRSSQRVEKIQTTSHLSLKGCVEISSSTIVSITIS